MRTLNRTLSGYFKPVPYKPRVASQRTAREKARRLAATLYVELEVFREASGINVWPTQPIGEDPYDGDHYAEDWQEVMERLRQYEQIAALVR